METNYYVIAILDSERKFVIFDETAEMILMK